MNTTVKTERFPFQDIIDKMGNSMDNDLLLFDVFDNYKPLRLRDNKFPPHNVIKNSDTEYTIEIALAGFDKSEVEAVVEDGTLTIKHNKEETTPTEETHYVHKGIAKRSFELSFKLPEFAEVKDAKFVNGMLNISIKKEIPKEKLPKVVNIK